MSKSINCKAIIILAVAINIIVSAFFNISKINAQTIVLKIVVEGKEYNFFSYEIGESCGEKHLKKQEEIINGIYLDYLKTPTNAKIELTNLKEQPFKIKKEKLKICKRDFLVMFLLGILFICISMISLQLGVKLAQSPSLIAIIFSSNSIFTLVFAIFIVNIVSRLTR